MNLLKGLFFIILIAGIGNTVLRPEMENPFTLFRLLAPIGLAVVFLIRPMIGVKFVGIFFLFFVYNFTIASIYSSNYTQFFPSIVHYLYLSILLVMMVVLMLNPRKFNRSYLQFIEYFYIFLLVNIVLELLFGSYYPNLDLDESNDGSVRAFFWSQNDMAVVLCAIGWMALSLDRYRGAPRAFVVFITLAILYINDSKIALISFTAISIPLYLIFSICATYRIPARVWRSLFGAVGLIVVGLLTTLGDTEIKFSLDTYTIDDLFLAPIRSIIMLNPSGEEWGSINNRTDAAIFALIEYAKTFGFGMGAGGSWLVLTLPQYELGGAKSPHNALLQFTVDFGYPVLLGYIYLVYWAASKAFIHNICERDKVKVMAILSFPLLGMSQSGAIVTNFGFFSIAFFIFLIKDPNISISTH